MHPRPYTCVPAESHRPWPAARRKRARLLLEFVRERGAVHPREVDDHFSQGTVRNYWGGSSSATTHLLEAMQYGGLLRVVRREAGIRIYAPHGDLEAEPMDVSLRQARLDALVDVAARTYAPLPGASLSSLVRGLRYAVPQWRDELAGALRRAMHRLAHAHVGGVQWFWPADERPARHAKRAGRDTVRLLPPFHPLLSDPPPFRPFLG